MDLINPLFAPISDDRPPHPGVTLRRITRSRRITQGVLASAMGVSRLTVNEIMMGKRPITTDIALRLGRVLDTNPEIWLRLQMQLDLYDTYKKIEKELADLHVLRELR